METAVKTNPKTEPKNSKTEPKEKQETVVEKMEGGILVRRYKGKKIDVET